MKLYRYLMAAVVMAAVLTGCRTRVDPYYPRDNQRPGTNQGGNGNQGNTDQNKDPELKENKTWEISYGDRMTIVDEDSGKEVLCEKIIVNNILPDNQKYLVSVINKTNYASYHGDILAFMKYELETNSQNIYQGETQVIPFGLFRHGTWYAFVIGLDSGKKLTGEYTYTKFTVEEEEPTAEYLSWLGNWTVSDGRISYDIQISKEEANQVYRLDGWEVREGNSDWVQMNLEYLETSFEPSDGRMYFVSQYITTYEDEDLDGAKVDELFLGIIDYDGITEEMGLYIIPDEGIDLAYAQREDEDHVSINPCNIKVDVGNDTFDGKFFCMQYVFQEVSNGNWHYYNNDSVSFFDNAGSPLQVTMVRTKGETNVNRSAFMRNGKAILTGEDKPLRGKVYRPRSENRAVKAVKL